MCDTDPVPGTVTEKNRQAIRCQHGTHPSRFERNQCIRLWLVSWLTPVLNDRRSVNLAQPLRAGRQD